MKTEIEKNFSVCTCRSKFIKFIRVVENCKILRNSNHEFLLVERLYNLIVSSSSSDLDNSSILESDWGDSICIDMWCFLNCSVIVGSKWFCSLMHRWLEARMFFLMSWPVNKFGIFVRVEFFSKEEDRVRVVTISIPVFRMDKNFISAIVEIPEIHIPELKVAMGDFFRESYQNGEFTGVFWNFDFTSETVTCWTIFTIANFPGVNDLKPSTFFAGLK